MKQIAVADYARQLFDQYGAGAAVIAAQRATRCSGAPEQARVWRRVQVAIAEMRAPAET